MGIKMKMRMRECRAGAMEVPGDDGGPVVYGGLRDAGWRKGMRVVEMEMKLDRISSKESDAL